MRASNIGTEILATAASNRRLPTINETTNDKMRHMLVAIRVPPNSSGPTPALCSQIGATYSQMIGNTAGSMSRNIYNNPHLMFALAPLARYPLFSGKQGKTKWSAEKAMEQTALHTGEVFGFQICLVSILISSPAVGANHYHCVDKCTAPCV